MAFTAMVAFGALVFVFRNALKLFSGVIRSRNDKERRTNWSGLVAQLVAWAAGVGAVTLAAHTQFAGDIKFGSLALNEMNWWTLTFIGFIATSLLSTVNEFKKAIDNSDSAKMPSLLTGEKAPAPVTAVAAGVTAPAAAVPSPQVISYVEQAENLIDLTRLSDGNLAATQRVELATAHHFLESALAELTK